MTRISLVRHGLVHNPDQLYYGRLPGFRLAEKGRAQAAAAGRALATESVAAIDRYAFTGVSADFPKAGEGIRTLDVQLGRLTLYH